MGQFIKQIFASLIGTVAGLMLFFAVGTSGLVLLLVTAALQETTPVLKDKSILVFDLSMQIQDTKPPSTLTQALQNDDTVTMTLRQVLGVIEKATKDAQIEAIFIDGRGIEADNGIATLTEVRQGLEKFRAAGKKIIFYDVDLNEKSYYLGSVADEIILNPMGMMEFNGIGTQPLFLAGALEKYGIGIQVIRVGEFKAAVEPFIRQTMSPENRLQTQVLLNDLWTNVLTTVGKSRNVTPNKLQAIADNQGMLMPTEAEKIGLIDRVAYFDEVVTDLKTLTGKTSESENPDEKSFPQISVENYASGFLRENQNESASNQIAVVYAEGEIVDGQGAVSNIGGERFAKELRKIRQDPNVKAVVLRINSPGGSATASDIIGREVKLMKEKKPVIVSMGNVAASGGYWIATEANHIFAEPSTITGSIGVFGMLFNVQDIANNNGITWDVVKTAKLADLGTTTRPKTEQELAIYQRSVQQIYNLFVNKVAQSRNLPESKVKQIAEGRVWSGEDAKQLGLVDEIGGLEAAILYAAKEAKLEKNWEIQEYPRRRTFESIILERLFTSKITESITPSPDSLTAEMLKLKEDLAVFQLFNDPKGIYAYLPFNWQIK
ncbi:signal peptide peptidase SppA, 67K type [Gloeothece citriformis PCC 7424]|uniref:Protease 4 n=1 Tax=Gloeothece citriformis (strain PCC 7424) TaxID=65393 RepID=B7KKK3_GLOC7|nr:signal peptide peptidase SppA [Gloeothece citriformis]ACK72336.1 signal peptide peptidase SppA, 67K type [Gloeothece citriformis PCC 7424]